MDALLCPTCRGPPFFLALWIFLSLSEAGAQAKDCPVWCPQNSHCVNTSCRCLPGFQSFSGQIDLNLPNDNCDDINECRPSQPDLCGANADCENTDGGFQCVCIPGFELESGGTTFRNKSENTCQDVEECKKNPGICKNRKICVNTHGSYVCRCQPGFEPEPGDPKSCKDLDECSSGRHQCDNSTICLNAQGSYRCTCRPGWTLKPGFQNNRTDTVCEEVTFPAWTPPPGIKSQNLSRFFEKVQDLSRNFQPSKVQGIMKKLIGAVDELLRDSGDLEGLPKVDRYRVATFLLSGLESALRDLATAMPTGSLTYLSPSQTELSLKIQEPRSGNVTLSHSHAQMLLDWTVASAAGDSKPAVAGLLSSRGMHRLVKGAELQLDRRKLADLQETHRSPVRGVDEIKLLSAVNSVFLSNRDTRELATPVLFAFAHDRDAPGTRQERLCAFWKADPDRGGGWATEGCETLGGSDSSTTCRCHHLSSFAVLMAHYDVQDPQLALITKVGLGLSLVCLLLCILTFLLVRPIQGSRTTVHLHLCLCLFVGSAVFLAGVENDGRGQVGTRCRVVAGLLHYCFLAAFCWMSLEGLELYFLVVRVFRGQGLAKHWLLLLGYGVPLFVVGVTASVSRGEAYGRSDCCWLNLEDGYLWSFVGPVTAIVLGNAVIFVVTVWKLAQKFSEINPDMKKLKKARALTVTAVAQLVVLGCTWGFGLFLFEPESWHSRLLACAFTLLNCLQGLFLFLLHCALNRKVREEYRRWACRLVGTKYSEFATSTTGSSQNQTQTRVHRPSESGM
ncbi:adhesion G protein-coupled receptor E5 isoform X2 [Erinaceus europaeus]|uniref:Adhesion G protein-coupled receptor E5 isoform X2 n=1 Tax=Erinaceus europaeus TaxID=9365 RepID=A0ABM3WNZ5_ERIEU|nr:adhesion G protein-coupled receptor E5 isoform X2 [Erinaceus europaeus]